MCLCLPQVSVCVLLTLTGSTFEEYVAVADYEPTSEGEVAVKAGEVVRVISREATGETTCVVHNRSVHHQLTD